MKQEITQIPKVIFLQSSYHGSGGKRTVCSQGSHNLGDKKGSLLWKKVSSRPLTRTIAEMITASTGLWRKNDSTEAKIRMIGLLNWEKRSESAVALFLGLRRLAPYRVMRRRVSPLVNPREVDSSCRRRSVAGMHQKDDLLFTFIYFAETTQHRLPLPQDICDFQGNRNT